MEFELHPLFYGIMFVQMIIVIVSNFEKLFS